MAGGAVVDAVEGADRITNFGEIFGQQFVEFDFGLDFFEDVCCCGVGSSDDDHEKAVCKKGRKDPGALEDGSFAGAAGRGFGLKAAFEDALFDLLDDFDMVAAPGFGESLGEIGFEEKTQVVPAFFAAGGVPDFRDFADVAAAGAGFGGAFAGGFLDFVVGSRRGDALVAGLDLVENPGGIAESVDGLAVWVGGDAESGLA